MSSAGFSIAAVRQALGDAEVASVTVIERFASSCAEVARLRIGFADGRPALTAIGKTAAGAGLASARRELRFFTQIAPLWAGPAPALLGAFDADRGDVARLLLLTEDLGAAGYALSPGEISAAQLDAVVDTLVRLHARFWDDLQLAALDPARLEPSPTQSAQAWPPEAITSHAAAAREAAAGFHAAAAEQLTAAEHALLNDVLDAWERAFLARAAAGRDITLIHGDFHLLGNVLFAAGQPAPRVIDWSELKPGLGPHDLAYCLLAAPSDDRPGRDLALLRRYWDGLRAAGVHHYGWELCQWDYRFAVLTNLLQSMLQRSVTWFRRTAAVADALECRAALDRLPCGA